jgi:hypothetical protein
MSIPDRLESLKEYLPFFGGHLGGPFFLQAMLEGTAYATNTSVYMQELLRAENYEGYSKVTNGNICMGLDDVHWFVADLIITTALYHCKLDKLTSIGTNLSDLCDSLADIVLQELSDTHIKNHLRGSPLVLTSAAAAAAASRSSALPSVSGLAGSVPAPPLPSRLTRASGYVHAPLTAATSDHGTRDGEESYAGDFEPEESVAGDDEGDGRPAAAALASRGLVPVRPLLAAAEGPIDAGRPPVPGRRALRGGANAYSILMSQIFANIHKLSNSGVESTELNKRIPEISGNIARRIISEAIGKTVKVGDTNKNIKGILETLSKHVSSDTSKQNDFVTNSEQTIADCLAKVFKDVGIQLLNIYTDHMQRDPGDSNLDRLVPNNSADLEASVRNSICDCWVCCTTYNDIRFCG